MRAHPSGRCSQPLMSPRSGFGGPGEQLPAVPTSRPLHRSVVDGGAAGGGAEQELSPGGGGGALGQRGRSGAAGEAARPRTELPALARAQHRQPTDSARAPGLSRMVLVCSSGIRCPALPQRCRCSRRAPEPPLRFAVPGPCRAVPGARPGPGVGSAGVFSAEFCTRFIRVFIQ